MKLYSLLQMIHHFVKASMVWTVEPVSARFACLWNALVFTNLIIITCMYNAVTRVTYMYNVYVHFIADFMVRYTHTKTCTMWAWLLSSRNWFMSDLLHRYQVIKWHYCDAIMGTVASQITSLTIVYTTVYSDPDQSKHQSSASLAFVWGIHRDRWIPRTKVQLRGKCFHLMTSSWMYGSSIYAPTQNTFMKFDLLLVFTRKHICAKRKILFKYLKYISTDMFLCL